MIEIKSNKQLNEIPIGDFVLLIKKLHSKDKLHKAICYSLNIFRNSMITDQGEEIIKKYPNLGNGFPKNTKYYHVESDETNILEEYNDKKCHTYFDKD